MKTLDQVHCGKNAEKKISKSKKGSKISFLSRISKEAPQLIRSSFGVGVGIEKSRLTRRKENEDDPESFSLPQYHFHPKQNKSLSVS